MKPKLNDMVANWGKEINSYYDGLEKIFKITHIQNKVVYASPVNFRESMNAARHRWFPYKEGFSPSFVSQFITNYSPKHEGIIFDPFCGVGTTPIVAGVIGLDSTGFDVNPLAMFVAKTKTTTLDDFSEREFKETVEEFKCNSLSKSVMPPANDTVVSYYEPVYLEAILRIKNFIYEIDHKFISNLFKLALLCLIEEFSTHRKSGNGVKKKTRLRYGATNMTPLDEVKSRINSILQQYLFDMKISSVIAHPNLLQTSCMRAESYDTIGQISLLLTSPPYANCFDYSKIYMQELWLGDFFTTVEDQRKFRYESLRSHVHATWSERHSENGLPFVNNQIREHLLEQKLWSTKITDMLSGYFKDIGQTLELIKPKLSRNAVIGFVVSNSFYGGIPIATDLLLGALGEKFGYDVESIIVYRHMIPSSQQYKLIDNKKYMRESLVVMRNN